MKLIKDSICCQVKKQNNTNENDSDNISDVNIDTSKVESKNMELNINQLILFFYNCNIGQEFECDGVTCNYNRYAIKSWGTPNYYTLVNNGVNIGVDCLEIHGVLSDKKNNNIDVANFWIRLKDNISWEGKLTAYKYNAQNSSAMDIFEKAIKNVSFDKITGVNSFVPGFILFLSSKTLSGNNFYNVIKQNGLNQIVYCKVGDDFKELGKNCTEIYNVCLNNFLKNKTSLTFGLIISEYNGIMGDGLFDVQEAKKYTDYFKNLNDCIVFSFLNRNKNIIFKFNPKTEILSYP